MGGHLWRTSHDVADFWDQPRNESSPIGILTSIDIVSNLDRFAGPGGWNDLDMLVVGLNNAGFIKGGGCNAVEYRTQMSTWCMLAALLMIGCDVRKMDDVTKTILLNKDIIDIDQDSLGRQGFRVQRKDGLEAFMKPLTGNQVALAFLNRNSTEEKISASYEELELRSGVSYTVFDVWKHARVSQPAGMISTEFEPHECRVFVLSQVEQ